MRQSSNTSSAVSDESQPLLSSARPTREAGRALLDDEHRHRVRARAGLGGDEVQVGVHAVGDEELGAVQHPLAAVGRALRASVRMPATSEPAPGSVMRDRGDRRPRRDRRA